MSVPVISMNEGQIELIAGLRGESRAFKQQLRIIEKEKSAQDKTLNALLCAIAKEESESYRDYLEKRKDEESLSYSLVPTLSEDGRSVVIIEKRKNI